MRLLSSLGLQAAGFAREGKGGSGGGYVSFSAPVFKPCWTTELRFWYFSEDGDF